MIRKNKIDYDDKGKSFYAPLKCLIYFGWTLGIFPFSFDRSLSCFRCRICSISTLFAIIRIMILPCLLLIPSLIPTNSSASPESKTNVTVNLEATSPNITQNQTDNVPLFMQGSSTTKVTLYITTLSPVVNIVSPFFMSPSLAEYATLMTNMHLNTKTSKVKLYMQVTFASLLWFIGLNTSYLVQFGTVSWLFLQSILAGNYTNSIWRVIFFCYEILFFFTIDTVKRDIEFLTDENNLMRVGLEKIEILNRNVEAFTKGFGWFLFLIFANLCVWWILM